MENESATPLDPVATEITISRALDELSVRRSNVTRHRARIDELRHDIARLLENLDMEKKRLRVTEQQVAEHRIVLGRSAEERRQPLNADKTSLVQHRARIERELSAAVRRARSLETEKLTFDGKVKDLQDQIRHLNAVVRGRNDQLATLGLMCRPVLDDLRETAGRNDAIMTSLSEALRRRVALERDRRECAKQESQLARENASLRQQLEEAASSSNGSEVSRVADERSVVVEDRWHRSLMGKLESDLASCRRDLEALRVVVGGSASCDVGVQT